ncbi:Cyclic diguanosine monophosphate-binding protein PA4608 [Gammaproteobacteria bacterium]
MKESSSTSERRRFTRVPFDTRARVTRSGGGQSIEVLLLDLCLQGALVELLKSDSSQPGSSVLNRGEKVKLELFLDEGETVILMETEAVHIQGQHVGLRCRALDLDSITHLRRLVELNLGDAELFQREIALLGQPIPSLSENR